MRACPRSVCPAVCSFLSRTFFFVSVSQQYCDHGISTPLGQGSGRTLGVVVSWVERERFDVKTGHSKERTTLPRVSLVVLAVSPQGKNPANGLPRGVLSSEKLSLRHVRRRKQLLPLYISYRLKVRNFSVFALGGHVGEHAAFQATDCNNHRIQICHSRVRLR